MHYYMRNTDSSFAFGWAIVMSCLGLVMVPTCNFLYFRHLEDWLQNKQTAAYSLDYQASLYKQKQ